MTTAVVCIVCIAMIVVGCMTLSQGVLTAADTSALSAQQLSVRESEIMRTRLDGVSANLTAANTLQAIVTNTGQVKLASFDKWDFIIQYFDAGDHYYVNWLPYHEGTLENNQWQKKGIYLNGYPETFEPGILNPQEQLDLKAILDPAPGYRAIGLTVAAPNGVAPALVCGPPALTAHMETVSAGGENYYLLKGWTPADGLPATETTDAISANETGRWLLYNSADPLRPARHLFPLSNVTRIQPADWTVHYRARADGWMESSCANALLDIDVIIRRIDGSVREAIATAAAPAAFTESGTWLDLTATYSFPGYSVIDETDYLEIDFYGESAGSGPDGTSYIRLRVDDDAVPASSQTRVEGILWS